MEACTLKLGNTCDDVYDGVRKCTRVRKDCPAAVFWSQSLKALAEVFALHSHHQADGPSLELCIFVHCTILGLSLVLVDGTTLTLATAIIAVMFEWLRPLPSFDFLKSRPAECSSQLTTPALLLFIGW